MTELKLIIRSHEDHAGSDVEILIDGKLKDRIWDEDIKAIGYAILEYEELITKGANVIIVFEERGEDTRPEKRYCKDCKHFTGFDQSMGIEMCKKVYKKEDMVYGENVEVIGARMARSDVDYCGKNGTFWERKK